MSELGMDFDEFWFKRTFPQIFSLIGARLERNKRSEQETKPHEPSAREFATEQDMKLLMQAFGS